MTMAIFGPQPYTSGVCRTVLPTPKPDLPWGGDKNPEPLPNLFFSCNSEEPACLEVPVSISKFPIPLWWGACGQMCMGARH